MPDKFYNTDDSFTDQGWSEMKKLLDRELPVRPVPFFRRRKGLLWLFLLLIPFGAAWGYFYWENSGAVQLPQSSFPEQRQQVIPSPTAKPIAAASAETEKCDEAPLVFSPVQKQKQKQTFIANNMGDQPLAYVGQTAEIPVQAILESGLSPLAVLSFQPGSRKIQPVFRSIEVHKPSPAVKALWNMGLEAGPLAFDGFQTRGVSGAVVVNRALGQSRWGLQAGLGYSYISRPFPSQTLSRNTTQEEIENLADSLPGPGNFVTGTSLEAYASSTDSTISRLHYLDLPLAVTYRPGKRWQLRAGGGVSLLLASQTELGSSAGYGVLKIGEAEDLNAPVTGSSNSIPQDVGVLNPFAEAGVTFFPLPRLGLGAQASFGLRDVLANWPKDQFVNKAQLKVSYWFR